MQWYLCLITIAATVFLLKVAVELLGRPIKTVLRLRRHALASMLYGRTISPPKPRELATTSHDIRGYDQAVRSLRNAERVFADLGAKFLSLGESEPAVRDLMALCGIDIVVAGHKLVHLSEVYATAGTESDQFRREIDETIRAINAALAVSRRHSRDALTKIRLEPIYLPAPTYRRRQSRSVVKPWMVPVALRHPQQRRTVRGLR